MMLFKSSIYSKDWMDIVFANRNKEYGAYQLRLMSGKATSVALLIVITVVVGVCSYSFIPKQKEIADKSAEKFESQVLIQPDLLPAEVLIEEKSEGTKVQQVAKEVSAVDLVKFNEINPTKNLNSVEDIAEEEDLLDKRKLVASFNAKGQKGGELIARGTFGETKQDGGATGRMTGAVDDGNPYGDEAFTTVEIMPMPKDGMPNFINWIAKNYQFPQVALDNQVNGLIQVKFVVEKDGSLSSFEVMRDMGYGTGKEAIRLLEKAKKWNPGIQNGVPVRVTFNLPIRLNMQ